MMGANNHPRLYPHRPTCLPVPGVTLTDVWLLQAAADFEAMAPWFVGEGIGGLFGDKFHKVRYAGGIC